MKETLWIWRAWSAGRKRICDCGVARAKSTQDAEAIARMCIGGPHRDEVAEVELEDLSRYLVTLP